ncbi:ABC transporter permease [Cytophagales bacterium RKSG123]|nr:ABC transporter permease [Xanthovirga aplysinae]
MFKNHLKIAFRNLIKQKFYSFINVLGLAVGLASCLLIWFWVQDELSYDRHHTNIDRLYRVTTDYGLTGADRKLAVSSGKIAETFKEVFPEVEESARIYNSEDNILSFGQNNFRIQSVGYSEPSLFRLFTIPMLKGDPKTALAEPNSMVIDESTAKRLFGDKAPIGKLVVKNKEDTYKVTGVFQDIPENSHFKFSVFCSLENFWKYPWGEKDWVASNVHVYLLLKEQANPSTLEAKFPQVLKTYAAVDFLNRMGMEWEEVQQKWGLHMQAVKDIHLHSDLEAEIRPNGSITYIYIFSTIALFILIIACINYMNLATARSADRAKEVGVRKVLGAYRYQLIKQFMTESFLLTIVSAFMALGLVEILLPAFNRLSEKSITSHYWDNWPLIAGLGTGLFALAILSGFYPAFFLSRFQAAKVLKGRITSGMKGTKLRNLLVVVQFAVSIFLIVGTLVVYRQLSFVQNKDVGFNREELLIVEGTHALGKQTETFKQELLKYPEFKSGTVSGFLPVDFAARWSSSIAVKGRKMRSIDATYWQVDYDYLKTLEMQMKEGRFFSADFPSDSSAIVLNEAAVKKLALESPLGKVVKQFRKEYTVIGVVKDFNYESLRSTIRPASLALGDQTWLTTFRIDGSKVKEALAHLETQWEKMAPGEPYSYSFLEDRFNEMYKQEQKMGKVMATFSSLAIFVACLGLFGLAAFTAEQRRKEIGIRKVLGSSIRAIVLLLSKDFARLIIIAFLIACPVSWWIMNDWLKGFEYRTTLGLGVFLLAASLSFIVAWITMSFHAIKAATEDPVNAIRYE